MEDFTRLCIDTYCRCATHNPKRNWMAGLSNDTHIPGNSFNISVFWKLHLPPCDGHLFSPCDIRQAGYLRFSPCFAKFFQFQGISGGVNGGEDARCWF